MFAEAKVVSTVPCSGSDVRLLLENRPLIKTKNGLFRRLGNLLASY
jgi:hypothetical protein